jgi:hypothetical protein
MGMMAARKSMDGNATSWSIRLDSSFKVVVHPANIQDREGAKLVLDGRRQQFPRLEHLWTDQGYTGKLLDWITGHLGWSVEVVERSPRRG